MTDRAALRIAPAIVLALLLAACGSGRADGELMRRVAAAEAAALRAEIAQGKAEQAAASVSNASSSEVVEEAEFSDEPGQLADDETAEFDPDSQVFDNEIVAPPAA